MLSKSVYVAMSVYQNVCQCQICAVCSSVCSSLLNKSQFVLDRVLIVSVSLMYQSHQSCLLFGADQYM